jgi:hypothetical protein
MSLSLFLKINFSFVILFVLANELYRYHRYKDDFIKMYGTPVRHKFMVRSLSFCAAVDGLLLILIWNYEILMEVLK